MLAAVKGGDLKEVVGIKRAEILNATLDAARWSGTRVAVDIEELTSQKQLMETCRVVNASAHMPDEDMVIGGDWWDRLVDEPPSDHPPWAGCADLWVVCLLLHTLQGLRNLTTFLGSSSPCSPRRHRQLQ